MPYRMVIIILLIIIAILSGFIIWLFKEFFVITPREKIEKVELIAKVSDDTTESQNIVHSVVGTTVFEPLKAPAPKPKKIVPREEIESAFLNNEFEEEHDPEPEVPTKLPDDVDGEVVDTDNASSEGEENAGIEEQIQIQSTICTDYEQINTSIKKLVRNEPLDINDAETLQALANTSIGDKIKEKMPEYLLIVQAAFKNKNV